MVTGEEEHHRESARSATGSKLHCEPRPQWRGRTHGPSGTGRSLTRNFRRGAEFLALAEAEATSDEGRNLDGTSDSSEAAGWDFWRPGKLS